MRAAPATARWSAAWLGGAAIGVANGVRLVAKQSWRELLADYDLPHGRLWPLVLLWLMIGPEARRAQS